MKPSSKSLTIDLLGDVWSSKKTGNQRSPRRSNEAKDQLELAIENYTKWGAIEKTVRYKEYHT